MYAIEKTWDQDITNLNFVRIIYPAKGISCVISNGIQASPGFSCKVFKRGTKAHVAVIVAIVISRTVCVILTRTVSQRQPELPVDSFLHIILHVSIVLKRGSR